VHDGHEIAREKFFPAPHQAETTNKTYVGEDIVVKASIGDEYHLMYGVGGGGGHQLKINEATVTFKCEQGDESEPYFVGAAEQSNILI
jgi:hypothetical protein